MIKGVQTIDKRPLITIEDIQNYVSGLEIKNNKLQQQLDKYKNVIDKIKKIPLKHIDNANEELQIILKNNNDLEYKNQCSHDFEIIKQNVEIIYNEILKLLEEVK